MNVIMVFRLIEKTSQSRDCVYPSTTPRIILYFLSHFVVVFFFLFLGLPCKISDLLLPWDEDYDVIGILGHEIQETAYRPNLSPASIMLTKRRHRTCPKTGKPFLYYVYFASKLMFHSTDKGFLHECFDNEKQQFFFRHQGKIQVRAIELSFWRNTLVYDHTTLKAPVLVRSPKLSNVGPG